MTDTIEAAKAAASVAQTAVTLSIEIGRLKAELSAALKQNDELVTKNLKLLEENNRLWDLVHNPELKK